MKVDPARLPDRRKIRCRMLMDNIRSERDVERRRDPEPVCLIQHTVVAIRELIPVSVDIPSERLSVSHIMRGAVPDRFIHPSSCLLPHPEGPVL